MEIDALISRIPSADEYYQSLKIVDSDANLGPRNEKETEVLRLNLKHN